MSKRNKPVLVFYHCRDENGTERFFSDKQELYNHLLYVAGPKQLSQSEYDVYTYTGTKLWKKVVEITEEDI